MINKTFKDMTGVDPKCPFCFEGLEVVNGEVISGFFCSECEEYVDTKDIVKSEFRKVPPLKTLLDHIADEIGVDQKLFMLEMTGMAVGYN